MNADNHSTTPTSAALAAIQQAIADLGRAADMADFLAESHPHSGHQKMLTAVSDSLVEIGQSLTTALTALDIAHENALATAQAPE